MARYRQYDYSQGKFIPVHFDKQILPGTFEYTLHYLIDNEIDLSISKSALTVLAAPLGPYRSSPRLIRLSTSFFPRPEEDQ